MDINEITNTRLLDNIYGIIKPKLYIRYEREYYKYQNLRLTFDRNIIYKYLNNITDIELPDADTVMELKCSNRINDNFLDKIINIQPSRFSKYSRGIYYFKNIF